MLVAPWVHSDHSNMTLWYLAGKIPNGLFDSWNKVTKFVNRRIAPSMSWSGGVISSTAELFNPGPAKEASGSTPLAELYGTSDEMAKLIEKLQTEYHAAEDSTAGNEDARLCLKKDGEGSWGICENYQQYVQSLVTQEKERNQTNPFASKLKVSVYYAESDMMIGKGGQKYFDECWRQVEVAESIEYESTELPGTNHDSTVQDLEKGALRGLFDAVKKASQR